MRFFRSSSGAGVRLERSVFAANYDKAFEYVSRHYRSRQGGGKDEDIIEVDADDPLVAEGTADDHGNGHDDVDEAVNDGESGIH